MKKMLTKSKDRLLSVDPILVATWYSAIHIFLVGGVLSLDAVPMSILIIAFLFTITWRSIINKLKESAEEQQDLADNV